MGNRIIQNIYTCDLCGETPEDGEKLWHMGSEVWCNSCCDKAENEGEDEDEDLDSKFEQAQDDYG